MPESTIQIITRTPEVFDPDPEPDPGKERIWRDPNGKIHWKYKEPVPILRYPNTKAEDKSDDREDKDEDHTQECLTSIRKYLPLHIFLTQLTSAGDEEMEKEILGLSGISGLPGLSELSDFSLSSDEDVCPDLPEVLKDSLMTKKSKKAKAKAKAKAKKKEQKTAPKSGKSCAELAKEKFQLQMELKAQKIAEIKGQQPPDITKKNIDDMKRLSSFINRNIKRYNKSDPPVSPEMHMAQVRYDIEESYKHLQNSFIDWDHKGYRGVCRVMDLPCYGRTFHEEDIEEHLHSNEHKNCDRSLKGTLPLAVQLDRVKREVKNGLSYSRAMICEKEADPY
ncbi:hypothetical protein FBEOM_3732 [Fusarium beomiforme]|uniref:Uncharacterized protein n=1 Tax=Fusarium beomiforme TaxID=44412 RepID=A0A9P5E0N5_9HYPO|nr:hypothetical protein FBEOM_3732 [Fusarium beomiforme]